MSGPWLPQATEHTFKATGRSAVLAEAPNVYAVFGEDEIAPYLGQFQEGALDDPSVAMRITEEIARSMMVRPRIARRDEPVPTDQDADDPDVIPYSAMNAGEVDELLEMWTQSIERAARFREERDGSGSGEDGEGVGDDPKPRPRAKSRKR